jgi:hypothetical protein
MSKASRLFVYLCLPCLALCLALTALAGNAHNFGGDVRILKVTEEPDNNVKVRLSLHIVNNSGADVKDASVTLVSSLVNHPQEMPLAWEKAETPIKIDILHFNERKIVKPIQATFTLPTNEYQRWQKNAVPNLMIAYTDDSGKARYEKIDIAPAP